MSVSETSQEQEAVSDTVLYADAIEYFETHDLSADLENRPELHFEVSPHARRQRYSLEQSLSDKVRQIARQRGVSAETLLNLWVQEKTAEVSTVGAAE